MTIDIICPATGLPVCEYTFEVDIKKVLYKHMAEEHPDWKRVKTSILSWVPLNGAQCPICKTVFSNWKGIDIHCRVIHKDYERLGPMEYVLKKG